MEKTINFNDEDLLKALAKHFKIKKNKIRFWYIRSFIGNHHQLTYEM